MKKQDITVDLLRAACKSKGYLFFEDGDYNLNIIGIRTEDMRANTFNDYLCLAFKQAGRWQLFVWEQTADPGLYYRKNPLNVLGTMILTPGQHRAAYEIGLHKGKYPALVQRRRLPVWRDNDRDGVVDVGSPQIEYGFQGCNIHHAAFKGVSKLVDKWSAGCQVMANYWEHQILMAVANRAEKQWGNAFTYTLFDQSEIQAVM